MTPLLLALLAVQPADTLTVRPGDAEVAGVGVEAPYAVTWVQYFETDGGRRLRRTIRDRVELEEDSTGTRLVRTQIFLGLDGEPTSRRVNRIDRQTLRPLQERWWWPPQDLVTHVDYDGRRVSGAMIDGPLTEPALIFDERLSGEGFDFNTAPLVLAALTLERGMVLRIPHVRISPPAFPVPELAWATLVVEGRERVEAGRLGTVEAWRLLDPDHDMVFWITGKAPHLVRMQFPIDDETVSVMELGTVDVP